MCALTHKYVWHDSFTRVSWRIHMWSMTHSYVCLDSLWLIMIHYDSLWLTMVLCPYIRTMNDCDQLWLIWLQVVCIWLIHMCALTHYDSLWVLGPYHQNHDSLYFIMTHLIVSCAYEQNSLWLIITHYDSLWLIMGRGPLLSEPWLIMTHYTSLWLIWL